MSQIQQQLLLDSYERYYKRGITAHEQGDAATAKKSLLKASESLFKLARNSPPQLRDMRLEKAGKVLKLAQSIKVDASSQDKPAAASSAGSSQAKGRGADDKRAASADGDAEDSASFLVAEVPDVAMTDVAGLEDVKAVIRKRVVYPFQHPEVTARYKKQAGGGILLYGPPGTGKTMIAKAIANEVDATFFSVKCSDIMSKWVGEAEANLSKLFNAARQHERAVVFMDETEAIVAKRGGDSTVMNRVIPEFLAQVDGVTGQHQGLLLLGATNRPWDMDEAALRTGRFGELIYVPLPDAPARRAIIGYRLEGLPLGDDIDLDLLAEKTAGLSGADLVGLCEIAKDAPYEREIETGVPQSLDMADVDAALQRVRPSVPPSLLKRYEKFRDESRFSA